MIFGLKNTGATYQKAIWKCLVSQIGKNMEAYLNDVVIKTTKEDQLCPSPRCHPLSGWGLFSSPFYLLGLELGGLRRLLMVNFHQPSHEFTFGVGINIISYPLVLIPLI
jgi:hypothetical protein